MPIVLAVASAVLLGLSDFLAARSARTVPSVTVTRTVVASSCLVAPLLLIGGGSLPATRDALLGAASGLAMIGGLLLLYRGYAVARMGVVAPLSSVLLAIVPVVWDLAGGADPTLVAALGMALGAAAVVLTSYSPAGGVGGTMVGPTLGIASGVAFGAAFTLMSEIDASAGLAPVILQRLAGLALLVVVALVRDEPFFAPRGSGRRYALSAGVPAMLAIAALQAAFQRGSTGPVAVASSQFASVAVVLAVIFNRERMRWWQAVGVSTTAVAVALIAAGG